MNTQKQIFLIVVLWFMLVGGCAAYSVIDLPYRSGNQEDYLKEESITRGALLFANNCRSCHGNAGEGGVGLTLNRSDLQDQDPLKLKANRDMLRRTLYCGRANALMQPWLNTNGGSLNDRQIDHLIDLITAPVDPSIVDVNGNPTNKGWVEAEAFARTLNAGTVLLASGDTLDTIAKAHDIGPKELAAYNGLPTDDPALFDKPVEKGSRAKLPPTAGFPDGRIFTVYTENDTIRKIAENQHVGAALIADANKLSYKIDAKRSLLTLLDAQGNPLYGLFPGQSLILPKGATYLTAAGDTLESIAAGHSINASDLKNLNSAQVSALAVADPLPPDLVLTLPDIKAYKVKGQSLDDIAKTLGNVTADSLGQANQGIPANAVVQVGQPLVMPADAWGSAPSTTLNPGTACVQYAVPAVVFDQVMGKAPAAAGKPAVPAAASKDVKIVTNATDFTITADGTAQPANKGVVLIAKGTAIAFENATGLHTITLNGQKDGDDFKQGDKRTITFNTAGDFKLTCTYHPDMLGWIFVQ